MIPMRYEYSDGGRQQAGYKGSTSDCVTRAIAIAAELPYQEVYDAVNEECSNGRSKGTARTGVPKCAWRRYLSNLGWTWTPTMHIGSGCKVHLRDGELPMGRLIVSVSKHMVAVVDGVIYDTQDPSREGTRCVYGYWSKP